jgi:Transglycosylase SLT domain
LGNRVAATVRLAAVMCHDGAEHPVVLAIALHCAPPEDPAMLVGVALQESGIETMILHDNTSGEVLYGAGVIDVARRLIAAGHSVDLGAWQINSRNLALLGLGIADVFEPCKAVAGAARLIELFSRYNTGSPSRDRKRLRRRGYGRDSLGEGRQPGSAPGNAGHGPTANVRP